MNSLGAMIAPPIVAVFMFGMFWKRGTATAANITFAVGMITGVFVFLLDFPYENLLPGFKGLAEWIANINEVAIHADTKAVTDSLGMAFMMQAWWKFVMCSVIMVVISLFTKKPTEAQTSICISLKDYCPKEYKGIKDFRTVGILIIVVLIILWTTLELIA